MRRCVVVVLLAVLALPAAAARRSVFSLGAGDALFWRGPHVEQATSGSSCDKGSCWTYEVEVADRAYRLRIGIDRPEVGDVYEADIFAPGGRRVGSISPRADLYSAEFLALRPEVGTWRIEVRARSVTESAFRMRAKLEAQPPSLRTKDGAVLPNLQVLPPHEASFLFPLSNGATGGVPQGLDLAGVESCHAEEHVEDGALRCLRFGFGVRNTGLGPLQLYFEGAPPADHELIQRVARGDDGFFDRSAGIARYHKTHGHYHHHDAVALQLYRVTDRRAGTLEAASDKHFKGFAHRDELLRDWEHFYPTLDKFGFGLKAGWADIYEWDRPGNYVDFGLNANGFYVVRMWADPVDGILESNERDNRGYTYLRVTGDEVELIEAGRGRDPWDRCKIEMGFGGHPDPPSRHRPNDCPRDTT